MTLEDVIATVDNVVQTRVTTDKGQWRVELTSFVRDGARGRSTTERRIGVGSTILEAAQAAAKAEPHKLVYLDRINTAALP